MSAPRVLLLALLALAPGPRAAEAPAPPVGSAGEAPAETRDTPADPPAGEVPAQDGAGAPATEDVFVPTVEVSEDTSVPFPVDI